MSCGKIYHFTEASAEAHADRLERNAGARPNVYKCAACGYWHVGFKAGQADKLSKKAKQRRGRYHRARQARKECHV